MQFPSHFTLGLNTTTLNDCLQRSDYKTITKSTELFFQLYCKAVVTHFNGNQAFNIFVENQLICFSGERPVIDSVRRIINSLRHHFEEGFNTSKPVNFLVIKYNQTFHFIKPNEVLCDVAYLPIEPAFNISYYVMPYLAHIAEIFQLQLEKSTVEFQTGYYGFVEPPTSATSFRMSKKTESTVGEAPIPTNLNGRKPNKEFKRVRPTILNSASTSPGSSSLADSTNGAIECDTPAKRSRPDSVQKMTTTVDKIPFDVNVWHLKSYAKKT